MGMKIGTLREIGAKKGDVVTFADEIDYKFTVDRIGVGTVYGRSVQGDTSYDDNWLLDGSDNWRIVSADAPTGPVRTVTRTTREIVPGVYGMVKVTTCPSSPLGVVGINLTYDGWWTAAELRAAIATLTEIAQALEDS